MYRLVSITFGLVLLLTEANTSNAATLTVTNCANQTDLQNKIDASSPGDTVTFACGTPSSPVTIPITTSVLGNGHTFTLDGNGSVILSGVGTPGTLFELAGSTVTIRDITLTGGSGSCTGGAMKVQNTPVTVINATIYNNAATGVCGRGGGIYVLSTTLTVINSTFSGDSATQYGNDIAVDLGTAIVENSIFLDGCFSNVITDGSGNIDTGNTCIPDNSNGSLTNVGSTILGALVNNLFFPLPNGSAALSLDTANCPARDELGSSRGATCNAGAIQVNTPPAPPPATPIPSSLLLALAGLLTYSLIYSIWPSRMRTMRCP
jgi:hypothetical protein